MHDAFINSKMYITCICAQNIHIMFKCMYIQNNQKKLHIYIHSTYPLLIFDALNIYDIVLIYYIIFTYIFHCLDHGFGEKTCCWQTGPTRVASRNSVEGYQSIHSWHPWWTPKNRGGVVRSWGHGELSSKHPKICLQSSNLTRLYGTKSSPLSHPHSRLVVMVGNHGKSKM